MTENLSVLNSKYVIDGVLQDLTPSQILDSVSSPFAARPDGESAGPEISLCRDGSGRIVDETSGTGLSSAQTDPAAIESYLCLVSAAQKRVPAAFSAEFTRAQIVKTLTDSIWRMGHFRLGDLCLDAEWTWNDGVIGNMAALYSSVQAAGDYLDALGICLRSYRERAGECSVRFSADIRPGIDEDSLVERPFGSEKPKMGAASLPSSLVPDDKSWIVYIPFDTSSYRLGGSLLAQELEASPAVAPQVNDPDYYIDCYEVVRELVEDGIVLSGITVAEGGLLAAIKAMTTDRTGADINLSDLRRATGEADPVQLLFAEVPGAIIQIRDIDFDYIDAELLLQDVAFYPLGHPVQGGEIKLHSSAKSGIQNILESLIRNQRGEGED